MEQILAFWNALDTRRRLGFGLALGLALATVVLIARMAATPSMALLYAGLEGARAGDVIGALDQRGIRYEVRGDSIWIDARLRDETRMALAAQGLPANAASGYELLDELSGFGTTSQMFDAAYWRAKEGELARTIMSSPHVRAARVHVSHGGAQPFRRDRQTSASVTVAPVSGALSPEQAQALRFLVASAVAGLAPEGVAVIDSASGAVVGEDRNGMVQGGERAAELRRNVERLLEAHVGRGRAVVEVNVDTTTDRETVLERLIDPESRVALSEESEERDATASDTRQGGVTVASNLPDGDAAGGDGRSDSREREARERRTWDVSQTRREVERGPGAIRRLTVAVLLDGVRAPGEDGAMEWRPRPEAELEALRELVASAVGYDAARGDVITLRSLPFEPAAALDDGYLPGLAERLGLDPMGLIRLAALALVLLILVLFVLRPILRGAAPAAALSAPAAGARDQQSLPGPDGKRADPRGTDGAPVLTGEIDTDDARAMRAVGPAAPPEDPVARMRRMIAERQDETVEILRSWMDEQEGGR